MTDHDFSADLVKYYFDDLVKPPRPAAGDFVNRGFDWIVLRAFHWVKLHPEHSDEIREATLEALYNLRANFDSE